MSNFEGLYNIRPYTKTDKAFVLSTWLRGLYYGDTWFSLIPKNIFMDNYKLIAEKIVESPHTVILVACLPDDPDVILGYSIMYDDLATLHWMFVKKAWREKGIGKSLLPGMFTRVTHLSDLGRLLLETKFKNITFNPFYLK
jgi:GNAT superfamily N-acetyltransferase